MKIRTNTIASSSLLLLSFSVGMPAFSADLTRTPAQQGRGWSDDAAALPRSAQVAKLNELLKATEVKSLIQDMVSKNILEAHSKNEWRGALHRDQKIQDVLDVLARQKNRVALLTGKVGVELPVIAETVAENIIYKKLPDGVHARSFQNPIIIRTTPGLVAANSDASEKAQKKVMTTFLNTLRAFEIANNCQVILILDKANQLSEAQLSGIEALIDSGQSIIPMIWLANGGVKNILQNTSVSQTIEQIAIPELTKVETFDVLKQEAKSYEHHYRITLSDEVLKAVVDGAQTSDASLARPSGPLKFLHTVSVATSRRANGRIGETTKAEVFKIAAAKAGLPVAPQDRVNFLRFLEEVKAKIKLKIKGNDQNIDRLVDLAGAMMTDPVKKTRTALLVGTSGTAKTYLAKLLAEYLLGSQDRVLEIDSNQLSTKELGAAFLNGPPPGYSGFGKSGGVLAPFFDGPGKNFSFLVFNEIEKAGDDASELTMELKDSGIIRPGDGIARDIGRCLIIDTSNQGSESFLPEEFLRNATPASLEAKTSKITSDDLKDAFVQSMSKAGKSNMKREVVGRYDLALLSNPILKQTAAEIAVLNTAAMVQQREKDELGKIKVDDQFSKVIVDETFDQSKGARPIKRAIETQLEAIADGHIKKFGVSDHLEITTVKPSAGTSFYTFVATNERGESITFDGPKLRYQNKMFDPEFKAKLKGLKPFLKSRIHGQDAMLDELCDLIMGHAVNSSSLQPLSIFLAGLTGTGKTELAKALALYFYGSEDYLFMFNMGDIDSQYKMTEFLGGKIGEKTPGVLEKYLDSFKNGVLLMDEMSNAGGGNAELLGALSKVYYAMLDEGKWTSPLTQKTYYLRDYIFIFTGNIGEKLFAGHTSPDMLRAIWEDNRSPEKVRELLAKGGFPAAFLGRIDAVILTEPPTDATNALISNKFVTSWKKSAEIDQSEVEISYPENFPAEIAKLTYNVHAGGRSIKAFVKKKLSNLLTQGVMEMDHSQLGEGERVQMKIWLEVKQPKVPFYFQEPDLMESIVHAEFFQKGKSIGVFKTEFTDMSQFMKQIRITDAYATAFHEAAHAVLNNPKISGQNLEFLTIVPKDHFLGYARYEPVPGYVTAYTHKILQARLVVLVGGAEAEVLIGRKANSGQSGDLEQINNLLTEAATRWGLVPQLQGIRLIDGKPQFSAEQQEIFRNWANKEIMTAREMASKQLRNDWYYVRKVAGDLIKKGDITGERFREIGADYKQQTPEKLKRYNSVQGPEAVSRKLKIFDHRMCGEALEGELDE